MNGNGSSPDELLRVIVRELDALVDEVETELGRMPDGPGAQSLRTVLLSLRELFREWTARPPEFPPTQATIDGLRRCRATVSLLFADARSRTGRARSRMRVVH